MGSFVEIRDRIRNFISKNISWLRPLAKGLLTLASLIAVNYSFGYNTVIKSPVIVIILSAVSAFIPYSGSAIIIAAYSIIHLQTLSSELAIVTVIMLAVLYVLTVFYRGSHGELIVYMPVSAQYRIPFCIPVQMALFGELRDIATVICAGVFTFFFKSVTSSAASFLDNTVEVSAMDVVSQNIIANYMFYVYIASLIALFLVVYFVRNMRVSNAWLKSVVFGLLTELVMMMAGYLFTGNVDSILSLIVGNIVTFVISILFIYIFRDLDYSRVENVQFEDDEYYYHVTAIPKIDIADEDRQVKRVTQYRSKRRGKSVRPKSEKKKA